MKKLASILWDRKEKKDFRRNIYLHNGRLICDKNDITPMSGKYPRTQAGTNKALDDIAAMYSAGVWQLKFNEYKKDLWLFQAQSAGQEVRRQSTDLPGVDG